MQQAAGSLSHQPTDPSAPNTACTPRMQACRQAGRLRAPRQRALYEARKRGWRADLRFLAEVQLLVCAPLALALLWLLASGVVLVWRVASEPYDPYALVAQP